MVGDFDLNEYSDAPEWLKQAAGSADNLLGRVRRARNNGLAEDRDVEDARLARDLVRSIVRRTNWRRGDAHNQ